jgi:hypothetical protein
MLQHVKPQINLRLNLVVVPLLLSSLHHFDMQACQESNQQTPILKFYSFSVKGHGQSIGESMHDTQCAGPNRSGYSDICKDLGSLIANSSIG